MHQASTTLRMRSKVLRHAVAQHGAPPGDERRSVIDLLSLQSQPAEPVRKVLELLFHDAPGLARGDPEGPTRRGRAVEAVSHGVGEVPRRVVSHHVAGPGPLVGVALRLAAVAPLETSANRVRGEAPGEAIISGDWKPPAPARLGPE